MRFTARGTGYSLFLTNTDAVLSLQKSKPLPGNGKPEEPGQALLVQPTESAVLRLKLAGANPAPQISALDPLQTQSNYFIGSDPRAWRTGVANFSKVKGFRDAFVSKIKPDGSGLVWSTYVGGDNSDSAWGIALNSARDVYITGSSTAAAPATARPWPTSAPASAAKTPTCFMPVNRARSKGSIRSTCVCRAACEAGAMWMSC